MKPRFFQMTPLNLADPVGRRSRGASKTVGRGSSRAKAPQQRCSAILPTLLALSLCFTARAQVNSGSTGSDKALDYSAISYTTNVVIDMNDHPTGIYNYTYVNIPTNVTVTFIPNANNTPVYWLVQSNVVINGTVDVSGKSPTTGNQGGLGGPGGWAGGNGGNGSINPSSSGLGPGGGSAGYINNLTNYVCAGQASFGTMGDQSGPTGPAMTGPATRGQYFQAAPGNVYGNNFLVPLLGGSGGGGFYFGGGYSGGGGGGGAILIAANGSININWPGTISANGGGGRVGSGSSLFGSGGGGSGGAIRLVVALISGNGGGISAAGGQGLCGVFQSYVTWPFNYSYNNAGNGRIRFDTYQNNFIGYPPGAFTQGSQFIIIPSTGQLPQLTVTSIAGVPVSASPTGVLSTPDAVISAQQNNPIPIVVSCANLPLNTQITVSMRPANGAAVTASGYNTTGTLASSTATVSLNMPRGGGFIYATAATGN